MCECVSMCVSAVASIAQGNVRAAVNWQLKITVNLSICSLSLSPWYRLPSLPPSPSPFLPLSSHVISHCVMLHHIILYHIVLSLCHFCLALAGHQSKYLFSSSSYLPSCTMFTTSSQSIHSFFLFFSTLLYSLLLF